MFHASTTHVFRAFSVLTLILGGLMLPSAASAEEGHSTKSEESALRIRVDDVEVPSAPPGPSSNGGAYYPEDSDPESNSQLVAAEFFDQFSDNAHRSGGDISVHGWWIKYSGPATLAKVKTWLQVYISPFGWIDVGYDEGTYPPGSGSGTRTSARITCANTGDLFQFRGKTDVDIIGYSDPSGYAYSPLNSLLRCNS